MKVGGPHCLSLHNPQQFSTLWTHNHTNDMIPSWYYFIVPCRKFGQGTAATRAVLSIPISMCSISVSKQWYGSQCLGFLTCVQMLMHATARGGCMDTEESLPYKVDNGRKFLCHTRDSNLCQCCAVAFQLDSFQTEYHCLGAFVTAIWWWTPLSLLALSSTVPHSLQTHSCHNYHSNNNGQSLQEMWRLIPKPP